MSNLSEEKIVSKYGHTTITLDSEDIEKLLQGKEMYNTDIDEYSFSVVAEEPIPLIPLAKINKAIEEIKKLPDDYCDNAVSAAIFDALGILEENIGE